MRIILLGAPGAGKGSIGKPLSKHLGIPVISTGDIFRKNISENTKLGQIAKVYISKGALVPDEYTVPMLEERLGKEDCSNGFILDGFPRTIYQGDQLDKFLKKKGQKLDLVLNVHLDNKIIINRLSNRKVCTSCGETYNAVTNKPKVSGVCDKCGGQVKLRADDSPEVVSKRLKYYYKQTEPLIEYYKTKGNLITIENDCGVEEGVSRAFAAVEQFKSSKKSKGFSGAVK